MDIQHESGEETIIGCDEEQPEEWAGNWERVGSRTWTTGFQEGLSCWSVAQRAWWARTCKWMALGYTFSLFLLLWLHGCSRLLVATDCLTEPPTKVSVVFVFLPQLSSFGKSKLISLIVTREWQELCEGNVSLATRSQMPFFCETVTFSAPP